MGQEDKLISVEGASKILGVSKSTVRRWTREGKLESIRTVGNHRRFRESDLRRLYKDMNKPIGIVFT